MKMNKTGTNKNIIHKTKYICKGFIMAFVYVFYVIIGSLVSLTY